MPVILIPPVWPPQEMQWVLWKGCCHPWESLDQLRVFWTGTSEIQPVQSVWQHSRLWQAPHQKQMVCVSAFGTITEDRALLKILIQKEPSHGQPREQKETVRKGIVKRCGKLLPLRDGGVDDRGTVVTCCSSTNSSSSGWHSFVSGFPFGLHKTLLQSKTFLSK